MPTGKFQSDIEKDGNIVQNVLSFPAFLEQFPKCLSIFLKVRCYERFNITVRHMEFVVNLQM